MLAAGASDLQRGPGRRTELFGAGRSASGYPANFAAAFLAGNDREQSGSRLCSDRTPAGDLSAGDDWKPSGIAEWLCSRAILRLAFLPAYISGSLNGAACCSAAGSSRRHLFRAALLSCGMAQGASFGNRSGFFLFVTGFLVRTVGFAFPSAGGYHPAASRPQET